ncbi:MAG: NUDIX domain-containing protein [Ruminococcaceae bacterium]|nr:NUDIX domain-containing protein [Oscillospiraceae bacterium]
MFDCGFTKENNWFRYRAAAIIVENDCVLLASNSKADYFYSVGGGIHMGEKAEDAVVREVFEETGAHYEVDRLAVIHENFFTDSGEFFKDLKCHEIALYLHFSCVQNFGLHTLFCFMGAGRRRT